MKRRKMDLNEFREFISTSKIICYGGGNVGIRAIALMENWGKSNDILGIIDRNQDKWNTQLKYAQFSYPIMSISDALKVITKDTVMLITCSTISADISEIVDMLNQYEELKDIIFFSLIEVAQQQMLHSDYKEILHEAEKLLIPKKIHYCWFGGEKPAFVRRVIDSWKKMCPDYEIIEWNDNNYDFTKNEYMKQAYDSKMWGFVSDYARVDIIYHHGGIYLDTDVKLMKKPDDLLYQKNFFIMEHTFFVNLGGGFGAQKGEPILKEFMDYYNDVPFIFEDGTLNNQACLIHQYNVLKKFGLILEDRFQTVGGANIYPMILNGTLTATMQIRNSEKAYFAHYGTVTWIKDSLKRKRKARAYFECEGLEFYDIDM